MRQYLAQRAAPRALLAGWCIFTHLGGRCVTYVPSMTHRCAGTSKGDAENEIVCMKLSSNCNLFLGPICDTHRKMRRRSIAATLCHFSIIARARSDAARSTYIIHDDISLRADAARAHISNTPVIRIRSNARLTCRKSRCEHKK